MFDCFQRLLCAADNFNTSLKVAQRSQQLNLQPANTMKALGKGLHPAVQMQETIRQFLRMGDSSTLSNSGDISTIQGAIKAAGCSSYQTQACAGYNYECASGDTASGSSCSSIGRISGSSCGGGGGGGWGGGWGGGSSIPLTPNCTPNCNSPACNNDCESSGY